MQVTRSCDPCAVSQSPRQQNIPTTHQEISGDPTRVYPTQTVNFIQNFAMDSSWADIGTNRPTKSRLFYMYLSWFWWRVSEIKFSSQKN